MIDLFKEAILFQNLSSENGVFLFVRILMGVMCWGLILALAYLVLYPLIWEREYRYHQVKAEVVDKNYYTTRYVTYTKIGETQVPHYHTRHHYRVTYKLIDAPGFLAERICVDLGESVFDKVVIGGNVELRVEEKLRRFRLSSELKKTYYGFEIHKVSVL